MALSKIRMSILPGLPGPACAFTMAQLVMLCFTELTSNVLVNRINDKVISSKILNNLTTAALPSFAVKGNYNCVGIGMQHND